MKRRIAALAILALSSLVWAMQAKAQNSGVAEYERTSREEYKKTQKASKKAMKKQIKMYKKAAKRQKKAMKKYQKELQKQ